MGRIRDFCWWFREHAGVFAFVLALLACGAGAAGVVIALDAKDKAEDASAATASVPSVPSVPTTPDAEIQATIDELNERVGAIEESVSELRSGEGTTTTEETTSTTEETTTPEIPEAPDLPEGLPDIPGVGEPESEEPAE